jgi:hypothetical protein
MSLWFRLLIFLNEALVPILAVPLEQNDSIHLWVKLIMGITTLFFFFRS